MSSSAIDLSDIAPGDTREWTAQTVNTDEQQRPLRVSVEASGSGPLVSDPDNGLQLAVELCAQAFDPDTKRCPAGGVPLAAGPAATLGRLESTRSIPARGTVAVRIRIALPATADNSFENTAAGLRVTFSVTGDDTPARPEGPLAVTGRDIGAALLGGLAALVLGTLVMALARRRREGAR